MSRLKKDAAKRSSKDEAAARSKDGAATCLKRSQVLDKVEKSTRTSAKSDIGIHCKNYNQQMFVH